MGTEALKKCVLNNMSALDPVGISDLRRHRGSMKLSSGHTDRHLDRFSYYGLKPPNCSCTRAAQRVKQA